jgi:predicted DsbA family dithiol-disulfide isomerase
MEAKLAKAKPLIIDIYSDIACPWCYVGKRKFALAKTEFIKKNPSCQVKVNYHAYMIDKATKKLGEEYLAYNERRWGGDGWTHSLRSAGKKVGCNFANWKTWPNTFLAHCLIGNASEKGCGEEVLDEVFKYCYEEGRNVSDPGTLEEIAKKYGLSSWRTKDIENKVNQDDLYGKNNLNIGGVPYFIFAQNEALEGAQDPSAFYEAFEKHGK